MRSNTENWDAAEGFDQRLAQSRKSLENLCKNSLMAALEIVTVTRPFFGQRSHTATKHSQVPHDGRDVDTSDARSTRGI